MNETDRQHSETAPKPDWSPIVELRQYTLHPGQREVLIDLFDSNLVESQEHTGMKVIGQFRDLDNPDKFVWLRGFADMTKRVESLADFYGGPAWHANRDAANATMIDSDDVLLLRPARPGSAFTLDGERLPPGIADRPQRGFVEATILHLEASAEETEVLSFFEQAIAPTISDSGGAILAYFVTEAGENNFPSLPVREGEQVVIWFAGFPVRMTSDRASSGDIDAKGSAAQPPGLKPPPQVLRLAPTSRSLLTGHSPACRAMSDEGRETRGYENLRSEEKR